MSTTRTIKSDDHSNHNLPIGATVEPCGPPEDMPYATDAQWYTQGIVGDERAIDPRDLEGP